MSGRRRRFGTFLRRATALLLSWVMPASTLWGGGGLASPVAAALAPTVESQASTAPSQQPVEARQTDEWATRDDERMEDPEHEHPDCDVEFWGPRRFTRTPGKPTRYTEPVTVPPWVSPPYRLQVTNGEADGRDRVSAATIVVDDVEVARTSDFSAHVAGLLRSVNLETTSVLGLRLESAPGAFLRLRLCGSRGDHTPPKVSWSQPSDGSFAADPTPRLVVTYADPVGAGERYASGVDPASLRVLLDGVDRTRLFVARATDASATIPDAQSLAPGAHRLVARVSDKAGNRAEATAAFQVDLAPPRIAVVEPAAGSYLRPPVRMQVTFSDDDALDPASLRISLNGMEVTSQFARDAAAATAVFDLTSGLVEGPNHLEAQIADRAGNHAATAAAFDVDTIAPVVTIGTPADGSRHGSAEVEVAVQCQDAQALDPAGLQLSLDDAAVRLPRTGDGAAGWLGPLADGVHRLVARARDRAGNVGSAQTSFVVDTTRPAVQIAQPSPGALVNAATPSILVAYADADGIDTTSLRVQVDGVDRTSLLQVGPDAAWGEIPTPLPQGTHTVVAFVEDLTGNEGTAASEFVIDTTPPSITFTGPEERTNEAQPVLTVEWTDAVSGIDPASARILVDGIDRTGLFAVDASRATGVLSLDPPLANGPHEVEAAVRDRAGNAAEQTRAFVLDTTAPQLAVVAPPPDGFVNEARPELSVAWSDGPGTGVDRATVHVYLRPGDQPETEVTSALSVQAEGARGRLAETDALADGTWTLRVTAGDLAGNVAQASATFVVDTVAPTAGFEVPADGAVVATTTPAFAVRYGDDRSGIDRSRLALLVDGMDRSPRLTWEATGATGALAGDDALSQGAHQAELTVLDRAGNAAAAPVVHFRVDTVAPTAAVEAPVNGSFVGLPNPPVRAVFADAGDSPSGIEPASIHVEIDGSDRTGDFTVGAASAEGVVGVPLADGPHAVVVRVTDLAGNPATAVSSFFVDTRPPAVHDLSVADEAWVAKLDADGHLSLSGQVDDLDPRLSVQCSAGGVQVSGTVAGGQFSCSVPLSEGANSVAVTLTDGGGHATTVTRNLNVDTTPPTVHILDPPDGSYTNARSLTVTGTVVDRSPVQVDVLGVSATVSGQSFVAVGIPVGDDGPMAVRATATDAAGNSAAHQVGLVVDRVPPVVHISRPTPGEASRGGALHVEGTFQDDSPVSMVYVNGQPATLQPSGPGGTFSATVTVTDGPILVEAAAHDAAGNVGTDRVSAIVDSTPPLLTIASPAGGTVTNAAAIHVSGAVHDETRVTLTLGNMPVAAAPDGSFEVEAPLGSTDGDQQLTLTAVDAAGNASAASVGVVVDRTAPQLEVVAPVAGAVLGALPVLVQGVVQDASAVSVAVDGVLATVTGSAWSVSLDSLAEGSHLFEVRATDAAGNASSASVQTQIDLSPPAVHIGSPASGSVTREGGVAVTGTVTPPSATVQVNGAAAVVSGTSFSVVVPLLEGDNSIHAVAQRPGSQRSSEDTILVTRDSTPPVVLLSAPEVVARERAGRVSVTATDNIAVASVEIRLDGTSVASFTAPPYEADLSVPATAHDGDTLTVTAIAVDRAGNTVTAERGMRVAAAGVIVGQVLAASTGLPMRAVAVRMLSGTSGAQTETDEHGRFTLPADGVRVAVRAERDGYTSVDRQASMVSEVGNVLVDARLTQLAGPVSIGPDGGTLAATGDGVEVVVPPGTVAAPADFALTPLSAQGLPGLLPLGWSPLVALDLRTAAPTLGPLTLRIANWAAGPVQLAAYRTSTLGWFVVARDLDAADGTLTASLPAPGAYALVAADQGEPVVVVPDAGQDLAGVDAADLPQDASSLAAATPATLPAAGGTAEGRLALVTATSLPSGTVVQAAVTETYTLGSGDVASEEKRLEDIVLFRAGAPADAALAATFPVTASRTFGPTDLVEGHVHLDILAGREGVRGKAAGNDAVTLSSGNLALSVAGGSLEKNTAVTLEASELSSFLPQTASLTPLAEAVVDVSGAQLTIAAELSMDAGSLPTGGTLLVARVVRVEGVPRLQVVSLAARVGDRVVTQPYPGLPGVREDGRYVFLRSAVPVGFVSGTVDGNGPVAALVMSNGMPLVFLSGADGRYILPTLTGSVSVSARALDGSGSATGPAQVAELQTTALDLPLTGGAAVVSVSPQDGATGVATTTQVEITSDVPLDPAAVTTGTLQLLKDGATVTVRVVLSASGKRVALVPESALAPSTTYTVQATGLETTLNAAVVVPRVRFTTRDETPSAFDANALQFSMPDGGITKVTAPAGSLAPGTRILIIDSGSGMVVTLSALNDGSVDGEMQAGIDDQMLVTVTDPSGNATTFTRSQFVAADGTTAIGAGGGVVTGTGGVELRIPAGATDKAVVLKLEAVDPSTIPEAQRPDFGTDAQGAPLVHMGGALKVTSAEMPAFQKEVHLAFAVPADAPSGAFYYVLRKLEGPDGKVAHETIDHAFVDGEGTAARVVTASPPFIGFVDFGSSYNPLGKIASTAWNISYLMWTFDQALPGKALGSVITGQVLRTKWDPGATTPSYEPVPAGSLVMATDAAGTPLTPADGAVVARTQADGTYALFDLRNTGGTTTVTAVVDGQTGNASVYEVPTDSRSPNLRYYRSVYAANVTFPAVAPPPPPPAVDIYVMDVADGNRRIVPNGLTMTGVPLVIGFRLKNGGVLNQATVQGRTYAVKPDAWPKDQPLAMDYVLDQDFTASVAGTYTVCATVLPAFGSPLTATRSFRAIAAGGGGTDNLPNDPPAVIGEQTVPPSGASGVSPSVFPQVVFSEPVQHVPGHVRLLELPAGTAVDVVLSGVGPDANGQPTVWEPLTDDATAVTSLTFQPRGGLKLGTRYRIEVDGGVVDLDRDGSGAPAPKALNPAPYDSEFTSFGPQALATGGYGESFGSPGLVQFGSTLFFVQNNFYNGTLKAFDVSNPVFAAPLELEGETTVTNRPVDIAGDDKTVVVATGPTNQSKPSNLYVFDIGDMPRVHWVGAAGLTSGAQDGFIMRVVVRDDRAYVATFHKGIQVVDLSQATSSFDGATGGSLYSLGYWDMVRQLNTDGQRFGPEAVVSTTDVEDSAGMPAQLVDLKVFDGTADGQIQPLVAAVGTVGLAVVNPQSTSVLAQGALVSADGAYRLDYGAAIAVGTAGDRTIAVVGGSGAAGDPPAATPMLAVVDLSQPAVPSPLGFLPLPESPTDITIDGDLAYVAATTRTYLVSIKDPAHPFMAGAPIETVGGRLALGADSGVLFSTLRSAFGEVTAQSGLHAAVVKPDANCSLLSLATPVVSLKLTRDPLNDTFCGDPGKLVLGICQAATVTVTVDGHPLNAPIDGGAAQDLSSVALSPGVHTVYVPASTLGVGFASKGFVAEAHAIADPSQVVRQPGQIEADATNRSVLPVGHTFVKGVDIYDGHLVRQATDLRIGGRHLGLEVTRSYSSAGESSAGAFGAGWSANYEGTVTPTSCGLYVVSTPDGSSQTFRTSDGGQTFTPQKGYHTKLVRNGDHSYDFTDKAGNRHHYREPVDPAEGEGAYRLDYIEEPHGDRIRVTYDGSRRVSTVSEYQPDAGDVRRLQFTWTQAGGFDRISSVQTDSTLGLRVGYEYDAFGNLVQVRRTGSNVAGQPPATTRVERYRYSTGDLRDRHQLLSAVDPNGNRTEYAYYAKDDPFPGESGSPKTLPVIVWGKEEYVKTVREFPADGQTLTISYSFDYTEALSNRFKTTVTDARGNDTLYVLNGYGAPTRIEEPLGRTTTFDWATNDIYKTREIDPLQRETTYEYDERGNLTKEAVRTADLGDVVTEYAYDPRFNKLTWKRDAEGHETHHEISDQNGDLLSTTDAVGDVTRYAYDSHGRLQSATDPRGHVTQHGDFDSFGNAKTTTDALGNVTHRSWDARGRMTLQADSLGHRTETTYDGLDRPVTEKRVACAEPCHAPDGLPLSPDAVTHTEYYPAGQPWKATNPNGARTTYVLDDMNRVVHTTTQLPEGPIYETATAWDANGNKVSETDRRGVTRLNTYDALNRLVRVDILAGSTGGGPDGTIAAYGYDLAGNKTSEQDVAGDTTSFVYDGLYRLARKTLPEIGAGGLPYAESHTYDRVGNRLSLTDANGHTTAWEYDGLDRVVLTRNALGQETTATYLDPEGSHLNKSEERDLVRGLRTAHAYDALNRETRREVRLDGAGGGGAVYTTLMQHDDKSHAVTVTDPRQTRTTTRLDSLDRPIEVVADDGGLSLETRTSYDGLGGRKAVRDPNGNVTQWTFDGLGRQTSMTDALGHSSQATYDGEGLKLSETDRRGVAASYTYDALARPRLTAVLPSLSGVVWTHEIAYDDRGHQRTETDARSKATVSFLDHLGRVVKETDALGHSVDTTWDGVNRRAVKDKRGYTTQFDYDALNRLTTTTDPTGHTTVTTYQDASNLRLDQDRRGTLTRTQTDPLGRVVKVTRDWNATTGVGIDSETNTWDGDNNRLTQTDAEGHVTRFDYDAVNRLTKRTDGFGSAVASATSYVYDANGNRTIEYDDRHSLNEPTQRHQYDALNRVVSTRDGENDQTQYGYDPEGNRTSVTEPEGAVTTYAYDERGKLLRVTQPGNLLTSYSYDPNRNLVGETDANGHFTQMTYDDLNRLRSTVQDAANGGLGLLTLHEYDENGNERLLTDPKTQTTTSTFDELNRLKARAWTVVPATDAALLWRHTTDAAYSYDPNGNLLQVDETVASGNDPPVTLTTQRTWDHLDRLETETTSLPEGGTATIRHAYYGNGTRKSLTDPAGLVTSYTYDAQNRLDTATTAGGTTHYTYYPDDLLHEVTYPSGVEATHVYDRANRLVSLTNASPAGAAVSAYVYSYDHNGNRLTQTETNGSRTEATSYTYDALDRLKTVTYPVDTAYPSGRVVTYGYDAVGNRTQETEADGAGGVLADRQGVFDSLNRLVSLTDLALPESDSTRLTRFGWDPNGNQTSKTLGPDDAPSTTRYLYDPRDKLVEVQQAPGLDAPPTSVLGRFQYDFEGRRIKKIGEEGLRQYVYDQTSLLAEYDENANLRAKYDYGSDRLISLTRSDEGRRYFSLDGLRSVVNLTDDSGSTVASYHLDAWGNFRFPAELNPSRNRFAFTGHIFDTEIGLYNAKARYFDPKLGRFLTQDSFLGQIDQPPSLHWYLYAADRPTFYVDPTGHGNDAANPGGAPTAGNEQDAKALLQQMADNPQPWHQTGPQNAPEPAVVEETTGEKPGLLARLWAAFNGTEEVAKGTDTIVGGMARKALNADKMSDDAADRARALAGGNSLPSGMTEEDVRNIAQGDRGAVRSGAASAAGGFAGVSAGAAYAAAKQYAVKKAAEAVEAVAGAGTRLARLFRRGGSKPRSAEELVTWVDEGGDLRAGRSPGMRPDASSYQATAPGARSNVLTGRGQAPYLEYTDKAGNTIGAKFDGVKGAELIDRKMNPVFSAKAVDQATRQAAVARHYNLQAVWELPTQRAVDAANRLLTANNVTGITVRLAKP